MVPFLALISAAAAQGSAPAEPTRAVLAEMLRQRLETGVTEGGIVVGSARIDEPELLAELYLPGGFAPIWGSAVARRQALDAILGMFNHGLDPEDAHARELVPRVAAVARGEADLAALVDLDLLLSSGLLRCLYTLHFGKLDPSDLEPAWNFSRELDGPDAVRFIRDAVASESIPDAVATVSPLIPLYDRLLEALARLRVEAAGGGWPTVPPGPGLRRGDSGPRVADLRARLAASGDLAAASAIGEAYGADVESAVQSFQRRHGLEPDGRVGPRTLAALDVTAAERVDQVRANLERLRWVFRDIRDRFLLVDIAGFELRFVDRGTSVWKVRVQVGKPYTETPAFRSEVSYLVFNPTWTVPNSIARRDLLPRERREPGYLAANGFTVLRPDGTPVDPSTVDWSTPPSRFPFILRQDPGPDNALGRVKFMFPNEHSVYLHDTPSRRLFDRTERAFSSGCIRVEHPLDLAERLLEGARGWDRTAIDRAVASGRTVTVTVPDPVPVMLLYLTAVVDESGDLRYRPDLYGRDARVIAGLAEPLKVRPPRGLEASFAPR